MIKKETLHPQGEPQNDIYPKTSVDQVEGLEEKVDKKLDKKDDVNFNEAGFIGLDNSPYTYQDTHTCSTYAIDKHPDTGLSAQVIKRCSVFPKAWDICRRWRNGEIIVPNVANYSNSAIPRNFFKSSNEISFLIQSTGINASLTSNVRNKLNNSLQLPMNKPSDVQLVCIDTNGKQTLLDLNQVGSGTVVKHLYKYTVCNLIRLDYNNYIRFETTVYTNNPLDLQYEYSIIWESVLYRRPHTFESMIILNFQNNNINGANTLEGVIYKVNVTAGGGSNIIKFYSTSGQVYSYDDSRVKVDIGESNLFDQSYWTIYDVFVEQLL